MRSKAMVGLLLTVFVAAMLPIVAVATSTPTSPVWFNKAIDTSSSQQGTPDVYDGIAVSADDSGYITTYDFETEGLTTFYSAGDAKDPVIGPNYVVFEDTSVDPSGDIYAKHRTTGVVTKIAEGPFGQMSPAISGDEAVYAQETPSSGFDVVHVDLSTGTTMAVTDDIDNHGWPAISGDVVVYEDDRNGDSQIYMYNLATDHESAIATATSMQYQPAVDGDIVVWSDGRDYANTGLNVWMKDLSTGEISVVCAETGDQSTPDIAGGVIVWNDTRDGNEDIWAYEICTGESWQVTENVSNQEDPAVDAGLIVWRDWRNSGTTGSDTWAAGFDVVAPTTTSDLSDHIGVTPSGGSEPKATYVGEAKITLTAEDDEWGSGVQKTWYKVDYVGEYYDGPFTVYRPGEHTLHYKSYDNVDNLEAYNVEYFDVISTNTTYTAIQGATRYETAVVSSQKAFPKGSSTVVIATGVNWPDALGGAALAKKKNGPILLTHPNAMASTVIAEIERLEPKTAYILGGDAVVSPAVEAELIEMLGEDNVTRIGGANRYETANLVAKEVVGGGSSYKVMVATGKNFPDALGASPLATLGPWPIVLAPEGKPLPDSTMATIEEIGSGYGVLLGGEAAVSAEVEAQLTEKFGDGHVTRLSGATRYDTAIACAEFGISHGLMWDGLAISTGANFPDALAGGILQGQADSVLLLTPSGYLHPSVAAKLQENRDWIGNVTYLGGTAAVSQAVRDEVESILKPSID